MTEYPEARELQREWVCMRCQEVVGESEQNRPCDALFTRIHALVGNYMDIFLISHLVSCTAKPYPRLRMRLR